MTLQPSDNSFQFESQVTTKIFERLVDCFIEDYMLKKYVVEKAGWRTLAAIATDVGLSPSSLYGQHSKVAPCLEEAMKRGLLEKRYFPGERGRGGEVMRLRAAYEKEAIRDYINARIKLGPKGIAQESRQPKQDDRVPTSKDRIVVLPFSNMSPDPKDEFFADGMTEEIISTISRIRGLQVVSRTSSMKFRGSLKNVREIASELGVGTVLEGSVRKAGQRLRISIQLIDTKDDRHLWSENYDREFKDIFDVQSDIAEKVSDALKVQLVDNEVTRISKPPTSNMNAFAIYLKGRHFLNLRGSTGFDKALDHFKQVIELDPNFALAYAGLADCYMMLENWSFLHPKEALPKAIEYSEKAIKFGSSSAEAHTNRGALQTFYFWDYSLAEREFLEAIQLSPSYATAHHWYGRLLHFRRRYEEAFSELRLAQQLDPLSPIIPTNLGMALTGAGRIEEAIDEFQSILHADPSFAGARAALAMVLAMRSEVKDSISEAEKSCEDEPELIENKVALTYVYSKAGRIRDAARVLKEMEDSARKRYVSPALLAEAHAAIGNREKAFQCLEKAVEYRSSILVSNISEPPFEFLRTDTGFSDLLTRIHLG